MAKGKSFLLRGGMLPINTEAIVIHDRTGYPSSIL